MTEPQVQYARTSDGVNIAFWTLGEGMPLVYLPSMPWSHIELEWQIQELRRWYEMLARKRKLVRFDFRGCGSSDRDVTDFSLESYVLDLEAIADRLRLREVALYGEAFGATASITYAARHPEMVSHLVLSMPITRASGAYKTSEGEAMRALREKDWTIYTRAIANVVSGWAAGNTAKRVGDFMHECVSQEVAMATHHAMEAWDVDDLLPNLRTPTLVLRFREAAWPPIDQARSIVSHIQDGRLAVLDGALSGPWADNTDAILRTIDEFLSEGDEPAYKAELPEGMAVILFADIAESTSLTEKLGDAAFREKARELDEALRTVIRECSGTPVEGKLVGDGVLAVFTSARHAIDCALRCNAASQPVGLQLHLGIHAGDVIREGNNVYGGAVNIAARIASASAPGEVLVSDTVRGLARTSAGASFDDRGEHSLKGVADPQRLYAVRGEVDG